MAVVIPQGRHAHMNTSTTPGPAGGPCPLSISARSSVSVPAAAACARRERRLQVLCASTETAVEPLAVPEGVPNGERVMVEGFAADAEAQLNPKKKVLEALLPDMATSAGNPGPGLLFEYVLCAVCAVCLRLRPCLSQGGSPTVERMAPSACLYRSVRPHV